MRRGEREAWRRIANASRKVAESDNFAAEYVAKAELRQAWASLYGIPNVTNIPRSLAALSEPS